MRYCKQKKKLVLKNIYLAQMVVIKKKYNKEKN